MSLKERIQRHFRERLGIQEGLNAFGMRARRQSAERQPDGQPKRRAAAAKSLHLLPVPAVR